MAIHLFYIFFCCHRQNMEQFNSLNPTKKIAVYCDTFCYTYPNIEAFYSFNPTSKILNMEYFVYRNDRHLLITLNGFEVEWVFSASPSHMTHCSIQLGDMDYCHMPTIHGEQSSLCVDCGS